MQISIRSISNGFIVTEFDAEHFDEQEYFVDSISGLQALIAQRFQQINSMNPTITSNLMSESVPF